MATSQEARQTAIDALAQYVCTQGATEDEAAEIATLLVDRAIKERDG